MKKILLRIIILAYCFNINFAQANFISTQPGNLNKDTTEALAIFYKIPDLLHTRFFQIASNEENIAYTFGYINFNGQPMIQMVNENTRKIMNVGNQNFSSGKYIVFPNLILDKTNVPYIAYTDTGLDNKAVVKKLNKNTWEMIGGQPVSEGTALYTSLAIDKDNTPYVAYEDHAHKNLINVKKFDGKKWISVGKAGFSDGVAAFINLAISKSNIPYVAYVNPFNSFNVTVMKFNGKNWVNVGNCDSYAAGGAISLALDISGIPYIAYQDLNNGSRLVVKMYDGKNWVKVGKLDSASKVPVDKHFSMIVSPRSDILYIAFKDLAQQDRVTIMGYSEGENDWLTISQTPAAKGPVVDFGFAIAPSDKIGKIDKILVLSTFKFKALSSQFYTVYPKFSKEPILKITHLPL